MVYGPENNFFNIEGDKLPGLIFKPLRGNIFGYENSNLDLLAGTYTQNFDSYQDVFLLNKDNDRLNIKCNPYTYPLNITENYDFTIDYENPEKTSIFNENSIFEKDYSSLNIVQTTDTSNLIGISSQGISYTDSGTITNLFNDAVYDDSEANNHTLSFSQIRQNNSGLHYNSSLNCSLFFTDTKILTDYIVNNNVIFIDKGISPGNKFDGTQLYNYGLQFNQDNVTLENGGLSFF